MTEFDPDAYPGGWDDPVNDHLHTSWHNHGREVMDLFKFDSERGIAGARAVGRLEGMLQAGAIPSAHQDAVREIVSAWNEAGMRLDCATCSTTGRVDSHPGTAQCRDCGGYGYTLAKVLK